MEDNYKNALNKIKNDIKYLKFTGCCNNRNVNGVTGPTGATGTVEPNPYNLYVQSNAGPGGDGSQLAPFQTIEQALAVVQPNGIINVLSGTYPVISKLL